MTHAREMLDTHPGTAGMDTATLVECIEACFDCAQTCSACADACLGEEMVGHMRRCITMCLNCSDVCATTGRIVSRQTEFEPAMVIVRPIVGDVPRVILDVLAEEEKPALLSFGSKVLGRAGRVMVGEVLDWVLGETGGPILVTPEPHPASKAGILERAEIGAQEAPAVLVATDGSEVSLHAGEYAARLAGSLGAKLFVLYVVDEHLTFHAGVHYREFIEMLTQDGREATGNVRALAEKVGVEAEELVVLGRPEQTILSVAEELGANPIFLGAEGMSRLEHAFIGSVSEEALRHANRTVIVVGGHPDDGSSEGENPGAVNALPADAVACRRRVR